MNNLLLKRKFVAQSAALDSAARLQMTADVKKGCGAGVLEQASKDPRRHVFARCGLVFHQNRRFHKSCNPGAGTPGLGVNRT